MTNHAFYLLILGIPRVPLTSLPGIGLGRAAGRGIAPPTNLASAAAPGLGGPMRGNCVTRTAFCSNSDVKIPKTNPLFTLAGIGGPATNVMTPNIVPPSLGGLPPQIPNLPPNSRPPMMPPNMAGLPPAGFQMGRGMPPPRPGAP